jgi:anti-anti-sigma factor
MSTSQRTFDQVKNILGKLDRNIDAARARRLQPRPVSVPTAQAVVIPSTGGSTPAVIGATGGGGLNQIIPATPSVPAPASPSMIGQSNGAAPQRSIYGRAQPRQRTDKPRRCGAGGDDESLVCDLMLRNLRKIFGVEERAEPVAAVPARPRNLDAHRMFTHTTIGQTMVVTVVEPELKGEMACDVCHEIRELYAGLAGVKHLVVDMENIRYCDSAGLNQLVDLLATVKKRHGRIGIGAATPYVEVLFKLTRLELVFTIRRSVIEAIDAVSVKD